MNENVRFALSRIRLFAIWFIVTFLLGAGALLIGKATAATCPGATVLAYIDVTTAYDDTDRRQIQDGFDHLFLRLEPGQRLIVRTLGAEPAASYPVFDHCMPEAPALWEYLIVSESARAEDLVAFAKALQDAVMPILRREHEAPRTAIVETLIAGPAAAEIWLFSDLLESSLIATHRLLAGDHRTMDGLPTASLDGVTVHAVGHGRNHDPKRRDLTDQEEAALLDAWRRWVERSGGNFAP